MARDARQARSALEQAAAVDPLTEVYSMAYGMTVLKARIEEANLRAKKLSDVFIDVDDFKRVNDEYGHTVGDHVLSALSNIVKQHIRNNDLFARWGGEELVLLCLDTKIEQASLIAEKIRELIASFAFKDKMKVTASFGVATLPANETLEQLFNNADKALYEAKHQGRNKVIVAEYV